MPHEFDSLFAELGEAKAQLQRSNRKAKALVDRRRAALAAQAQAELDRPLFGWPEPAEPTRPALSGKAPPQDL